MLSGVVVVTISTIRCSNDADCNMAGVCSASVCSCFSGWHGASCELLDLLPQPTHGSGAAYNDGVSVNSSWGIAPLYSRDDNCFHAYVSEMVPGCGISTWLPGSRIVHVTSPNVTGPYVFSDRVLPPFSHNPHITRASDGTFLLFFNGQYFPDPDFSEPPACTRNKTGGGAPHDWHGGGACATVNDCNAGGPWWVSGNECVNGTCVCEHHSFGRHCQKSVETVNLLTSKSLYGPWTKLKHDGEAFFTDGALLSNPSGFALQNGTIVLAYSRAPALGVAIAPSWHGNYTRLFTMAADGSKNYSLVNPSGGPFGVRGGEDPFIWLDRRGIWRMIFHGYGEDGMVTDGQAAWSTDLLHWHAQPTPVYSSTVAYEDGSTEVFSRRERPALLFDDEMNPTHLFNGVMPGDGPYKGKVFSYVQRIRVHR